MQVKGKIVSWNDVKGFGFVAPYPDGKQMFIHIKAFRNRNKRPVVDQFVYSTVSADGLGRPCAENAILAGDQFSVKSKHKVKPTHKRSSLSIILATVFMLVVGIGVLISKMPPLVFVLYVAVSLFTFLVYAWDKSAAKRDAQRIRENTLHVLSIIGGWPGALIAQEILRHKTKKQSFRSVF